jgi:phage host-nuclease inhibitor protein Gam
MPPKKTTATTLTSWDDVNDALRRLGEIEIARQEFEGRMTLEINETRARYAENFERMAREQAGIEANIAGFVEENKAEFLKTRSRTLDFGTVAFRVVKKIVLRNTKAVVAAIRALGWVQYLRVKEEPDKEALNGLSDTELARIGVTRKIEDKLRIEPNIERLQEAA